MADWFIPHDSKDLRDALELNSFNQLNVEKLLAINGLAEAYAFRAKDSWKAWQAAKAQAVHEWKDYELEKPNDGQKCLVIFESKDCEDAQRWMCIDEFNEGMFDFIANWEDQCASVALPAGSIISKVRAVCWATTNLSNAPLSFDQFYEAQEPSDY